MRKKYRIHAVIMKLLLITLVISSSASNALDAGNNQVTVTVSIHEVAKQIRQYKSWQILDASPRKLDTGADILRFKLLHEKGKVIIINIDPKNPNLRRLE